MNIRSKLILSLVSTNLLIAGLMFFLASNQFDKGFQAFLNLQELQKLTPFKQELALQYQQQKNWDWVHEYHRLWQNIIHYHLGIESTRRPMPPPMPRGMRANRENNPFGRRPPPRPPEFGRFRPQPFTGKVPSIGLALNINPHIALKDANGVLIIGREDDTALQWLPINDNGHTIGSIGVKPFKQFNSEIDAYFINQQKKMMAIMIIIMLSFAVFLALLFSKRILNQILLLQQGFTSLVRGQFSKRLLTPSNDELGQLSEHFNYLAKTLESNQQARQQWIADISHELRTPTAILKGEIEAIVDGVRPANKTNIKSLQQEIDRLNHLINDLHELTLSDLGALSYQKEPEDLIPIFQDFYEDIKDRFSEKGLTISFRSTVNTFQGMVDVSRLEQCLMNFMQNTLRYTDMPGNLNVTLREQKQHLIVTLEDSSPGVLDKDLPHLLDRLYRAEKSRNREKGGAGLGLSISKNILDAHDITIELYHSKLGGLGIKLTIPQYQNIS